MKILRYKTAISLKFKINVHKAESLTTEFIEVDFGMSVFMHGILLVSFLKSNNK